MEAGVLEAMPDFRRANSSPALEISTFSTRSQENPVASALMSKMKMRTEDRPRVKAECLRLLASLRLDPARATVIGVFVESYLALTAQEMTQYERVMEKLTPTERTETVAMMTSWQEVGVA